MNLEAFLAERSHAWDALERDLGTSGRAGRLPPERTLEVGRDYRAVVADLAFARRRFPGIQSSTGSSGSRSPAVRRSIRTGPAMPARCSSSSPAGTGGS